MLDSDQSWQQALDGAALGAGAGGLLGAAGASVLGHFNGYGWGNSPKAGLLNSTIDDAGNIKIDPIVGATNANDDAIARAMNAQRTQPRWQTIEQMPQQMVGQTHWYPNAQAQASMDNVYVNPNANDVQMSVKPPKEIRSGEVKNLRVVTQDEFNLFVDGMLHKDYTNMPNIVKVESFNNELKEALGIPNADFYITKKHISHIREERKAKYNQALRPEEIKNIPQIIRETRVAYIDKANHNFFVAFPDVQDSNRLNFIHFNADENGNYMVTAKKAHKDTVNSSGIEKQYQLVQAGAAPAIPNPSNSDLPLTNFEVSNTNQLSNST
ncbi:MAG: hypothetical protein HDT12_01080, partial [Helicobacter sp.]|nr:hypothetical protein [Helicobacter sp.]